MPHLWLVYGNIQLRDPDQPKDICWTEHTRSNTSIPYIGRFSVETTECRRRQRFCTPQVNRGVLFRTFLLFTGFEFVKWVNDWNSGSSAW
jgi:hypothetical protein